MELTTCDGGTLFIVKKSSTEGFSVPGSKHYFFEQDFELLHIICSALNPIDLVVKTLCKRDCNLAMADAAVNFAILELQKQNNELSTAIAEALESRIAERRSSMVLAANFLCRCGKANSISELNAVKYVLISLAKKPGLSSGTTAVEVTPQKQLSLAERIQKCN
jgi:hypothetical protein